MCVDPVTATVVAATAFKSVGSFVSGQGEIATDRANADAARATGYANENMQRDQARQKMAEQAAALSNRSMSLSSGTPLALQAASARNSELDALQIRANATNQANIYDFKAKAAQAALPFSVAGQILGGGTQLAQLGKL